VGFDAYGKAATGVHPSSLRAFLTEMERRFKKREFGTLLGLLLRGGLPKRVPAHHY
jgi:hypothetical protein